MTKKLCSFILLLAGMFSFSVADAQFVCDCVPGHPAGYCYVDSHGHTRCKKFRGTYIKGRNESVIGIKTSSKVYPNPVSNSTAISFSLEQLQNVSLSIFDMSGRLVSTLANKVFKEGENELVWNADRVNAGIYFLQIQSEKNQERIKLVVTK